MAEKENITTSFRLDISDFKKGITEANQQIKLANAEFNAASAGMEDWENSTEGLEAKIKQLKTVLEAQTKKLDNYNAQLDAMREAQDKNAKTANDLRVAIDKATAEYGEGSKEVKALEKQLNSIEKEMISNESAMDKLNITILNQQGNVNKAEKEIGQYEQALKDLDSATDEAEDSTKDLGEGFTVLKGSLASLVADGVKAFIGAIGNAIAETKEFRKEMSLLKEVADENNVAFSAAQEAYKNLLATSGDEGASTETLNNLLTAGFDEKNLDQIVAGVEGLAIRFKDTLKQEGIADSIQEWIGSGGESLTGNFAEALERMGYNLETVTAQTKGMTAEQRQQWVISTLQKEGLNELSASYRENNAGMIEASNAQFELTNAIAKFAEVTEPVVTAVKGGFAELLNTLFGIGNFDLSPFTNGITKAFEMLIDLLKGDVTISELIEAGINWVEKLSEGLVKNIPTLISKGLDMFEKFVDLLAKNVPKLVESGISFIRNLVKGLMNALPELIARVPEMITKFMQTITSLAPIIIKGGVGIILDIIKGLINAIPTLIANIPKIIQAIVSTIEAFSWLGLGKKVLTFFTDGIKSMFGKAKEAATGVKNKVVEGIESIVDKMKEIGTNLVKGLWNGINDMTSWVKKKIKGFSDGVLEGIKNFFGVHSPSRETAWIGEMLGEGLGDGLVNSISNAVKGAKEMANAVLDELHGDLDTVNINPNLKGNISSLNGSVNGSRYGLNGSGSSQVVNFNQTINSPKAVDRLSLYRQTNSMLFSAKVGLKNV